MANELFAENPTATIHTAVVTAPTAGTQETWSIDVGSGWPSLAATRSQFRCVTTDNGELVLVTAGSTAVGTQSWAVTRGVEGSPIAPHAAGVGLQIRVTAAQLTRMAPRNYLYLPGGWDDAWQAAKAASASTPARILFLGDSVMSGVGPSDWTKAYPILVRASLATQLGGSWGDYFPSFGYQSTAGVPPWSVLNASATQGIGDVFGWHRTLYDVAAVEPTTYYNQTFTSPFNCTSMDLFWVNWSGTAGTWKHSVDGGADVTVSTPAVAAPTNATVNRISSGALANAIHTWSFGKQSASGIAVIAGAAAYSGSSGGLACSLMANGQAQAYHWNSASAGQYPTKRQRLLAGVNPQTDATANTALGFGFPTAPHLAIIELGVNDVAANVTLTNTFDSLAAFCAAFRAGQPNCSILFHVVCNPDQNSSDGAGLNGTTPNNIGSKWHQYTQYVYLLAQTFNAAVLNTHAKWGETPVGQGFLTVPNTVHPTDAGHLDIANDLLSIL